MRWVLAVLCLVAASCVSESPPEAWDQAERMAQSFAGRVDRIQRIPDHGDQQRALEAILLAFEKDLAPQLRLLCGRSCVVSVEYRVGALRQALGDDDASVGPARDALRDALNGVVSEARINRP